jgi:D-alanyl-D-alanine carboxypeptidase
MASTLQRELEEARAEQNLTGLAMAVAFHDDRTLWSSAVGSAVLEPQEDWTPSHTSRMGSVTKTFTATVIHQLVSEGALSLDDPIEQFVPGSYIGVSIRDLLGMSSGIVSYNYVGSFDESRSWTPEQLVQWAFDNEPTLRFEPGTDWEYSNTNYVLLGLVIEAVTGRGYEEELRLRLFEPLSLDSMWLATSAEPTAPNLVHSYEGGVDLTSVDPSFGWAAGSLVSTPRDLARWNDALFFGDVLQPDALTALITSRGLTASDQSPYGLGVFNEGEGDENTVGHTGGIAGHLTYAYTLQEQRVTVVVMANDRGTDLRDASTYGWAAVLGVPYP